MKRHPERAHQQRKLATVSEHGGNRLAVVNSGDRHWVEETKNFGVLRQEDFPR